MKNVIKIFFIIISIILLFILSIFTIDYLMQDKNIPKGYYKSDTFGDKYGFQHYLEYYKYYYNDSANQDFYKQYNKISEKDIEEIKSYCNDFKERMKVQDRLNEYDFDDAIINKENYLKIIKPSKNHKKFYNYTIYIYDTNAHVLYCLHSS